ncbi:MAG: hypothetical protein COV37_16455 [Bdellovibrio sp. CG11_big_fil_rev_8_21_14_0_20_39_38]|nr:MAG: hypothetical protein COW78_14925 [Bdellovibrio sp. CG22_combo_CG10-13_8_21_14_all_39_27]PIR33371.1 MAG: hypothetical protein COV37_16455 [Bdellovibrio sp. CG11_big_fil_rev_8_21_14_0_20_39_38]
MDNFWQSKFKEKLNNIVNEENEKLENNIKLFSDACLEMIERIEKIVEGTPIKLNFSQMNFAHGGKNLSLKRVVLTLVSSQKDRHLIFTPQTTLVNNEFMLKITLSSVPTISDKNLRIFTYKPPWQSEINWGIEISGVTPEGFQKYRELTDEDLQCIFEQVFIS